MKIRTGYVSNSSSSSFVIMKRFLSEEQVEMIKNHSTVCRRLCEQGTNLDLYYYDSDAWSINETELTIEGDTSMDNFSMYEYLHKIVGVDPDKISWEY